MGHELLVFGLIFLVHAQTLEEGTPCTASGGITGTCQKARVCPSVALNPQNEAEVYCSPDGGKPVVCCTDCYIADVSNAVATLDGIVWKTAGLRRSYDKCVEYASTLPYSCNMGSLRLAVNKAFNSNLGCHDLNVTVKQLPPRKSPPTPTAKFPYLALLGYNSLVDAKWKCQGSIISEKFVLTTAHCETDLQGIPVSDVAVGIDKRRGGQADIGTVYEVKSFYAHPEYVRPKRYMDIGLVETRNPIKFNINVLPICLTDRPLDYKDAKIDNLPIEKIQEEGKTFELHKMSEEACSTAYPESRKLPQGIIHHAQACYPNFEESVHSCLGSSGRPIYVSGDLKCMKYAVGITAFGSCGADGSTVFTLVPPYISWIVATVWP